MKNWAAVFEYNESQGLLIWRPNPDKPSSWNAKWEGKVAGFVHVVNKKPRAVMVRHMGVMYYAHRIIWEMHRGPINPRLEIDHIDRDPTNNKLSNLRLATHAQNMCNVAKRVDNTSGIKGVTWCKRKQKWKAQIGSDGTNHSLGYHHTRGLAGLAYAKAALRLHGKYARLQ